MEHEPTMALTGCEVGTVKAVNDEGISNCLLLRLHGKVDGKGPVTQWRVAVHPDNLTEFVDKVSTYARSTFPDRFGRG